MDLVLLDIHCCGFFFRWFALRFREITYVKNLEFCSGFIMFLYAVQINYICEQCMPLTISQILIRPKLKKIHDPSFFHFLAALWNCIVHQPKTLSQPVRQSVASQPFNQSAFSQSLSNSIIKEVGLSMKHFDNVNWAILSQQISQSVGEPNSKLPASQSVIPLLS